MFEFVFTFVFYFTFVTAAMLVSQPASSLQLCSHNKYCLRLIFFTELLFYACCLEEEIENLENRISFFQTCNYKIANELRHHR